MAGNAILESAFKPSSGSLPINYEMHKGKNNEPNFQLETKLITTVIRNLCRSQFAFVRKINQKPFRVWCHIYKLSSAKKTPAGVYNFWAKSIANGKGIVGKQCPVIFPIFPAFCWDFTPKNWSGEQTPYRRHRIEHNWVGRGLHNYSVRQLNTTAQ